MICPIVHDPIFLSQPSAPADAGDVSVADDLLDTLRANADSCVGMAANMIGVTKCVIVFDDNGTLSEMFNPEILTAKEPFEAQEGCLSLAGVRTVRRFRTVKIRWQNRQMQTRIKTFTGWTAQIIQHEIDHCKGILI